MMKTVNYKDITWIDIEKPTGEDIDFLRKNYDFISENAINELLPPSQRSKIESGEDYTYFVIYFPVYNRETRLSHNLELDIIVSKNLIITNHYQPILPYRDQFLFDKINTSEIEKENYFSKGAGFIIYSLLEQLLKSYFPKLDHIGENIRDVEEHIFNNKEKEMIHEISHIKRNLLSFRQALKPQKSILESLLKSSGIIFGKKNISYFEDLNDQYNKVWENVENLNEILEIMENTNNSLFSAKLNEIIKVLTIVSVIFLPPMFIANFLGMNILFPFSESPTAYILIGALMILATLWLIMYFRKKKWL